jgi:hypothetical protein
MTRFDRLSGIASAAAVLAGLVWASHAPMTAHASANAVLRLAWSALPERIETCRERSDEELEHLPQHMRQRVECEGAAAHYRLTVQVGGRLIASQIVHAGGLRQDRRIYVFREFAVPAGDESVAVHFERVETPDTHHTQATDNRQLTEAVPPRLAFVDRVRFQPRAVILVTYDPERRELTTSEGSVPSLQ